MRIAVSGAGRMGKTTFIRDFLNNWPNYKTPEQTYRKIIEENKHSQKTDGKIQLKVLNELVKQVEGYNRNDNVIHDRCPLDNLVYSMWAFDKGNKGCDPIFMEKTIGLVKESMRHLDIIFVVTTSALNKIVLREGDTNKDLKYLEEIDNIFKEILTRYNRDGCHAFFPKDDMPALIDLHGNPEERIALAKMYVTPEGGTYGEDQTVLNTEEMLKMHELLGVQKQALADEQKEKDLYRKFGL